MFIEKNELLITAVTKFINAEISKLKFFKKNKLTILDTIKKLALTLDAYWKIKVL